MRKIRNNSNGISETVTVIIVIILVLGLALAVYGMLFGSVSLVKTSLVAASAGTANVPLDTSSSMQVMRVTPEVGENFYIKGQGTVPTNSAATQIAITSFSLRDPQGEIYPVTNGYITKNANKYGTNLYIYKNSASEYKVTDSLDSISYSPTTIRPFALGDYQITMIDNTAHVPLNIMNVKITGNATSSTTSQYSLPLLNVLPNSSWAMHGGVSNRTDPVTGLTLYDFDGTSGYLSSTTNPSLGFTGELTLSLWMNPTATGSSSSSANWHTIIGKGFVGGVNSENDNYQIMQLGDKLLFEWNDASSPYTHYQATTTSALTPGSLQYVTATVTGGVLSIQVNGVSLPLTYNTGNVPGGGTVISAPTVTLQNNGNDLLTGKQNAASAADYFYYSGDMSEVALYNRALTAEEIAHNINYYKI
ncbi:LamG domain-containing protein [uncultured Methanoregula sp.]|uniref:LamG domain-containing protein n=1 Tax=uncultured Methanoregula sp. TaxID=1005933 RepID=UPI002AAAF24A|nr:LamG domain-containing protein [uncultured Methanoregula sp.]